MHLDPGALWWKVIVLGKMLGNNPIRLQNGFPLSRSTGLHSGGKRDRISQLVRTCWSFFILVLSERRVQSPGIPPSRVNAWTRNTFSAPDSCCRTKWFYRPQTQLPPTCKRLGLGPSSQTKAAPAWYFCQGSLYKETSSVNLRAQTDFPSLDSEGFFPHHFLADIYIYIYFFFFFVFTIFITSFCRPDLHPIFISPKNFWKTARMNHLFSFWPQKK